MRGGTLGGFSNEPRGFLRVGILAAASAMSPAASFAAVLAAATAMSPAASFAAVLAAASAMGPAASFAAVLAARRLILILMIGEVPNKKK